MDRTSNEARANADFGWWEISCTAVIFALFAYFITITALPFEMLSWWSVNVIDPAYSQDNWREPVRWWAMPSVFAGVFLIPAIPYLSALALAAGIVFLLKTNRLN